MGAKVGAKKITKQLKQYATKILVEELKKRKAVEFYVVNPYENYEIRFGKTIISESGPVNILIVLD